MKIRAGVLLSLGCLMVTSCVSAQSGKSTTSATQTTSASGAKSSAANTPQAGWKNYISARWGYSVSYPGEWYDLPNSGAPDTQKYFSNEKVGGPLEMTSRGVFETIEVQPNSAAAACPRSYVSRSAVRQAPTTVDGVATTRYASNMVPSGAEPAYIVGVWVLHRGNCYSIQFLSLVAATRDATVSVADQAIASFNFGS